MQQDTWLTVITRDPEGIVASFGATEAPGDKLPPAQPVGSLHALPQEAGVPPLQLLEAPFDAGRRAVRRAARAALGGEHLIAAGIPLAESADLEGR